jgi:hypothetical protein
VWDLETVLQISESSGFPSRMKLRPQRPLRPARPDCANYMDETAERHYTEESQQLRKAKQLSGSASASNKSRFMVKCICLWLRRPIEF